MSIWRQLRWQILATEMVVVLVGVVTLIAVAGVLAERNVPPEVLPGVRATVGQALLLAAIAATVAGMAAGLVLTRTILRPLNQLARGSRRIADGRFDERVAVPPSDELAEVANSFNDMAAALQRVEQQRVAMIGNVAHELRTPLAGLEGYLEGLMDGVFSDDPETLGAMQHEVRRLHRLVDDLQQLSRVEAGQIALRIEPFDLLPLVQRVAAQLRPQALSQCLQVEVEADGEQVLVLADRDRTAQVLVNLIGNAIRYTPEGRCITVRVSRGDGEAAVAVEDEGIGIPPDALPYIFERFYRVDPSRSRSSGGSGIGLTIARHLAWAMGGELAAASEGPGRGSTFTLTLPLARAS